MKKTGSPDRDVTLARMDGITREAFSVFPDKGDTSYGEVRSALLARGTTVEHATLRGVFGKLYQARLIERSTADRWRTVRFQPALPLSSEGNTEEAMNHTQYQNALANQTAIARRVIEAVPLSEPWPLARVASEYNRLHGLNIEFRVLSGALLSLEDAGLVRERRDRTFIRVAVKPAPEKRAATTETPETTPATTEETMSANTAKTTPAADPISRLGDLSAQLRRLADDIDTAALDAQQAIENAGADSKKLAGLREMLKGL